MHSDLFFRPRFAGNDYVNESRVSVTSSVFSVGDENSGSDETDDDLFDDDGSSDGDDEQRDALQEQENARRNSISVPYDASHQLAIEYIIRREEAHD